MHPFIHFFASVDCFTKRISYLTNDPGYPLLGVYILCSRLITLYDNLITIWCDITINVHD